MPHSRAASVLLAVVLLLAAPALAQGSEKPPAVPRLTFSASAPGGENVGTSILANVTPTLLTIGSPFDLCFTVFVQSPDLEYGDRFDVNLPDGWTVNSVAANSVPVANGCGGALPPVYGTAAGNVVSWQSAGTLPTGCGAWNGGSSGTNFDFCANVTIPNTTGSPWTLPWNYIGDGWGGAPHSVAGNWGPIGPLLPGVYLSPEETLASGCPCETQQHELTIWNNTGAGTTVNFTYAITQGSGTCTGPAQSTLADGETDTGTVEIYPQGDFGDVVICEVTAVDATNPAYTDTATISKTLIEGGFDPAGWQAEPITGATGNQWAGAAVGTHPAASGPVGYVVGGLGVGSSTINPDLQMFDPATGTWTQLADLPDPRFSPVVGWIGGLLYVAGGYNSGFAGTNELQVYNPAIGTWDYATPANLPVTRGGGAGGVGNCSSGSGECLFHVGGGPDSSFATTTQETWQYDPIANAWTQLDNKPAGSSPDGQILGAGVGCLGLIYVGGDYRGYHDFFVLDPMAPAGSRWTQRAAIPAAAGAMTPTLVCKEDWGAIVLLGGDPDGSWGTYNTTVFVYDIATNTWDGPLAQELAVGQLGSAGWHLDGKVWTVGGTVGSGAISPMPFESLLQLNCEPCSTTAVTVTVVVEPPGAGTVTGAGVYNVGDLVTLTATPNPGSTFLHWLVDSTQITVNPYSFTAAADVTVTAVFAAPSILEIPALDGAGLALLGLLLAGAALVLLRRT